MKTANIWFLWYEIIINCPFGQVFRTDPLQKEKHRKKESSMTYSETTFAGSLLLLVSTHVVKVTVEISI